MIEEEEPIEQIEKSNHILGEEGSLKKLSQG